MIRLWVTSQTCTRHFAVWCGACSPDRENEFFIITSQSRIIFGVYAIIFIIVFLIFFYSSCKFSYIYFHFVNISFICLGLRF